MRLTELTRYPVKSCRGQDLDRATVEPWGLVGDRRWMVVDGDGVVVTAREHPRLVLVSALPSDDGLQLQAPDREALFVPVPQGARRVAAQIWDDTVALSPAGEQADGWFSDHLGLDVRLVYLDDPTIRPTDARYGEDGDVVSLADGYPLLLAAQSSLDAVNELIAAGRRAEEGPLPMRRFRPNVVVDGSTAWEEDSWRRIRIGEVVFRAVKGCERCVLTLVDPATAAVGREPLASLVKHRRFDGQSWFAINLVPDGVGELRVGDEVEVLERSDAVGPLR